MSAPQEKKYYQYFSTRPIINIIMPSTKRIRFVAGSYITDKQDEIDFLNKEIEHGNQMIYTKQGREVVGADALDPLAAIKKKAIEEYLSQQKEQANPNRDMGNTDPLTQTTSGMQTSKSIAQLAAGLTVNKGK